MTPAEQKLIDDLRRFFENRGLYLHASEIWSRPSHGASQIALLVTDRSENLTGLNSTGLEKVVSA